MPRVYYGAMGSVIILFARAPILGRVKTRLIPALGEEGAMKLHERLVQDALERLGQLGPFELHTDQPTSAWPGFTGIRAVQAPGDLGSKMYAALSARAPAMIVGSDAPQVPIPYFHDLLQSAADVAIGPAEDGGYYAIAARRTDPRMFAGVEWSSGRELRQTIRACEDAGLSVHIGHRWFDIDTPQDLERAQADGIL